MQQTPTRIPTLQRSRSFHNGVLSSADSKNELNEEEMEALDDVSSLNSIQSAVSHSRKKSYNQAIQSSTEQRNKMKYHLHCSNMTTNPNEYLTPTQRANITIKRLKSLLSESQVVLQYKDMEIQRLTRELVELRLQCNSVEPAEQAVEASAPSLVDSGHFDDLNGRQPVDSTPTEEAGKPFDRMEMITAHKEQVRELKRKHAEKVQHIRNRLTDRLEQALQQLGDANGRYANLLAAVDEKREQLNSADSQIRQLRDQVTQLQSQLSQSQIKLELCEMNEYTAREKSIAESESLNRQLEAKCELIVQLELRLKQLEQEKEDWLANAAATSGPDAPTDVDTGVTESIPEAASPSGCEPLSASETGFGSESELTSEQVSVAETINASESVSESDVGIEIEFESEFVPESKVGLELTRPLSSASQNCTTTNIYEQLRRATEELEKWKELYNKEVRAASEQAMDHAVTLKFLRSAVFYLLTDHVNTKGHLRAIQRILDFSTEERIAVERAIPKHGFLLS